jgi:hypothetical protein
MESCLRRHLCIHARRKPLPQQQRLLPQGFGTFIAPRCAPTESEKKLRGYKPLRKKAATSTNARNVFHAPLCSCPQGTVEDNPAQRYPRFSLQHRLLSRGLAICTNYGTNADMAMFNDAGLTHRVYGAPNASTSNPSIQVDRNTVSCIRRSFGNTTGIISNSS